LQKGKHLKRAEKNGKRQKAEQKQKIPMLANHHPQGGVRPAGAGSKAPAEGLIIMEINLVYACY